ncbi:MAG: hypothetical protein MUE68_00875 [Bacteroidetes bacterium]|jgi:hypothetical protein|nr:hypothetical protein [Bacteroidota bacterium]
MRRKFGVILSLVLAVSSSQAQWKADPPAVAGGTTVTSFMKSRVMPQDVSTGSSAGRRSVLVAVAASLILPGAGEFYAGNFEESGQYSLGAEAALWITYAGFHLHGSWVRTDARTFGTQMAGVSFDGKDSDFEVNIGNFLTVEAYNDTKLRNREFGKLYTDPAYAWAWTSDADRNRFREERIRSDRIFQAAKFAVAGLVVNRIISAFAAGRGAAAANRAARRAEWGIGMNAGVDQAGAPALVLNIEHRW